MDSIERYTKIEDSLAAFPEWQEKVKEDIGSLYHLIHNNLAESESKRKIFRKLVLVGLFRIGNSSSCDSIQHLIRSIQSYII